MAGSFLSLGRGRHTHSALWDGRVEASGPVSEVSLPLFEHSSFNVRCGERGTLAASSGPINATAGSRSFSTRLNTVKVSSVDDLPDSHESRSACALPMPCVPAVATMAHGRRDANFGIVLSEEVRRPKKHVEKHRTPEHSHRIPCIVVLSFICLR